MGYLIVAVIAALALSISAFDATASLLVAFLAYSVTGTLVMISAMLAEGLQHGEIPSRD